MGANLFYGIKATYVPAAEAARRQRVEVVHLGKLQRGKPRQRRH